MASTWADKYAAAKDRTTTSTPLASKLLTPKTPEQIAAEKAAVLRRDNLLQSQVGRSNTFTQGGQTQVRIGDYNSSGAGVGETAAPEKTPARSEIGGVIAGHGNGTGKASVAEPGWSIEDTMNQWDEIFGEDNAKAFAGANEALDSQIAGNTRRQAELSAVSGRSAAGGGYQSGAAQAALSAGAAKGTLASNFYQNQQRQKQSFLERQLQRALQEGQFDKAQQLELALAQIDMAGQIGQTEADTIFQDSQYADYTGTKSPGSYGGGVA